MVDDDYFTVLPTSCTIPTRGALAIYCGDKPRRTADGRTSIPLRAPLLLMPQDMWADPEETMLKVADVLNRHAVVFFPSAADRQAEHDRAVLAGER